jgi:hypothetical protein
MVLYYTRQAGPVPLWPPPFLPNWLVVVLVIAVLRALALEALLAPVAVYLPPDGLVALI